ncbi:PepSY-associated TM helix domain-containing protein [Variovorax sp. HJSM1_2]|uniref:PepSY-associated TM helix domain-containing protein n=1 Tax=Variovorax sp. HJSM1_2 TaxID=3366263 RepID=UPI003BCF8167
MKSSTIRIWAWVHKWSSIVCTLFMLLLCLTGLPLVFNHELSHWLGSTLEAPALANPPPPAQWASVDQLVESAHQARPKDAIQYLIWDDDPEVVQVIMAERPDSHPDTSHTLFIDARNADMLGQPGLNAFIFWMLKLHTDLFLGLPGKLFMGGMGLLFAVAVVSGVVLYSPFMRKLDFGTVRHESLARTRWLDLHNLLGIATLVWAMVVGVTGVVNTLADVAVQAWRADAVAAMVARYANKPAAAHGAAAALASTENITQKARAAEPSMTPYFIAWPGTVFSTPHHYAVYMRGNSPLTARLWKPLLMDAHSGELTDRRDPPWYLTGLLLTQPLHFGDYGGMPMKILWAVLDVITIVVLGSGLYLWLGPRRAKKVVKA